MEKVDIDKGRSLLFEYIKERDKVKKQQKRNEIFELLLPWELIWIKSIMRKRGSGMSEREILSLSWDCFLNGLNYYKLDKEKEIPFPKHFHTYARYFLLDFWRKEEIEKFYSSDDIDIESIIDDSSGILFIEALDEIKRFREFLPGSYKIILEDALLSLVPNRPYRQRRVKEAGISKYRYDEAKRILSMILNFMLKK